MDLSEIGLEEVDWTQVVQCRCRVCVVDLSSSRYSPAAAICKHGNEP
jgi:hypothetical protein